MHQGKTEPIDKAAAALTGEYGHWSDIMSQEQTAYMLAQVTAVNVLPPLVKLQSGHELLDYNVRLRDYLRDDLVWGIAVALDQHELDSHWQQIQTAGYACVIGAGVAANLDMTPDQETLSLRCTNTLAMVLSHTHRATELPRSLLFLQTALYERFDALLEKARAHAWFWLAG
jgi:hypothetical protein